MLQCQHMTKCGQKNVLHFKSINHLDRYVVQYQPSLFMREMVNADNDMLIEEIIFVCEIF